jgi:hypothetical protein
MTTQTFLPARPSLESLRKQAKKLARDIAAGDTQAIARARVQLREPQLPLSQRDAQLVLAREYGFTGWRDLIQEVYRRLGQGLEWAAIEAKNAIRDNNVERLEQLLKDFPALVTWKDHVGWQLMRFTGPYRDSIDPRMEENETRPECAIALLDAGAKIDEPVWKNVIMGRARGMLELYRKRGVLPRTLLVLAALDDLEGVRACFEKPNDPGSVHEAFIWACRYQHKAVAAFLLERCIDIDPDLGKRIDAWKDRDAFIAYFEPYRERTHSDNGSEPLATPWQIFVLNRALELAKEGELPDFLRLLENERWLLGESHMHFQADLFQNMTVRGASAFVDAFLALDPAILHHRSPPGAKALDAAFSYSNAHLIPQLTRIWPLPDNLPTAAGMGDLANVKKWFDASGRPVLGDPRDHYQGSTHLHWWPPNAQHVLDISLAYAVLNRHFEIATFLLEHGADINTNWSTHEPAGILHELVFQGDYEQIQFVIDHGIDLTLRDHRWKATAQGWAFHAKKDEKLARFLADAEAAGEKSRGAPADPVGENT